MKALAIIVNIFFPGIGTLIVKKYWQGITQILLGIVGAVLTFTVVGALVGIPLMLAMWIWALVSAITADDKAAEIPDSKTA